MRLLHCILLRKVLPLVLWFFVLPSHDATIITSSEPYGTFDQDSREDCRPLLQYCQSDLYGHVYVQCAKSCTDYLQATAGGGDMVGTVDDEDAMYQLPPLRLYKATNGNNSNKNKNKLDMERFEGSVTVVAIVPLLPGMAAYNYELLVHVHETFAPHLECIVIPIDHGHEIHIREKQMQLSTPSSSASSKSSVWVVEEESALYTVPLIQHLSNVKPRNGSGAKDLQGNVVQVDLPYDRVTMYIISADSQFVERIVSPTLKTLNSKIHTYLKTIDYEL